MRGAAVGYADVGRCGVRITTCRRMRCEGRGPAVGAIKAAVFVAACLRARQLRKKYGNALVPERGPIPAHLLGNIWSQEWNNVYSLMDSPKPPASYDLTKILADRKTDPRGW